MSGIIAKMLQAAAAGAGGALDIADVFSTDLYTGNGSTQTITNGIDLAGEGGLVWLKARGLVRDHILVDTERGGDKNLNSIRQTQKTQTHRCHLLIPMVFLSDKRVVITTSLQTLTPHGPSAKPHAFLMW